VIVDFLTFNFISAVHFLCRKENEPKENAASVSSLKPEGRKTPILGLKFE